MLQLLLQINPLGVLLSSVHDRLIVIRRRNLVNPVLLVLLARIVLWIKRLIRRLVLSLMSHPRIDALQNINDAFEVVLGVTKRHPLIEVRLHSWIQHFSRTCLRKRLELQDSCVSEVKLSVPKVLWVGCLIKALFVLFLNLLDLLFIQLIDVFSLKTGYVSWRHVFAHSYYSVVLELLCSFVLVDCT